MAALLTALILGSIGAVLGWGAGSSLPGLKEIASAFALFGGLLAAILGAVLGGVLDIIRALQGRR